MPPLYHVDAFADRPFTGNPAAVVVLDRDPGADWMQCIAAEMNLSETAFIKPDGQPREPPEGSGFPGRAGSSWTLRWFTPAAEVELCGHATLAAAHILWETHRAPTDAPLHFQTRFRGTLTCEREGPRDQGAKGSSQSITMAFPTDPPRDAAPPAGLLEALRLSIAPINTARARYDWIIELPRPADVRNAQPNFPALAKYDCRGIALTATAKPDGEPREPSGFPGFPGGPDIISRFFAPRLRINEDPVTGSVHCALGPYWSARLGKPTLRFHQASPRGGSLVVTTHDGRVGLAGRAVTIARGELLPPPV